MDGSRMGGNEYMLGKVLGTNPRTEKVPNLDVKISVPMHQNPDQSLFAACTTAHSL